MLGQKRVGNADGISGICPLLGENRRRIASAGENTNIRAAKVVTAVLAYNILPLRHKIGLSGAVADLAGVKCGAYRTVFVSGCQNFHGQAVYPDGEELNCFIECVRWNFQIVALLQGNRLRFLPATRKQSWN